MGMPDLRTGWTLDEVHALPDDANRYELIDGGLLVTPAPSYTDQRASLLLAERRARYAASLGIDVLCAPFAVRIKGPGEVQPDLVAFPTPQDPLHMQFVDISDLILAVEILSEATAHVDRGGKRRLYQRNGVQEYWIVDVARRLVERWRPGDEGPDVASDSFSWEPRAGANALSIDLVALFREIHREA